MSPVAFTRERPKAVEAALRLMWATFGNRIRDARFVRQWTTAQLATRAGVSRSVVFGAERGEPVSMEAAARLASALGLRPEIQLVDPRRRRDRPNLVADPVHSAMGELEAGHMRRHGFGVGLDEPYQRYQFAGRADVAAWDLAARALLHIENRTRFPDLQEMAGAFNAKRAYFGRELAERLGIDGWASETHVIAALWSAEVLHMLRLRTESFRAICPQDPAVFADWWAGKPPTTGRTCTLVVLDPLASDRQRSFVGLEDALSVRPRHRGYADAAEALLGR